MAASVPGSEYKMKKAKGDMKKKGKPDPYAYVPLARSTLNKRYFSQVSRCILSSKIFLFNMIDFIQNILDYQLNVLFFFFFRKRTKNDGQFKNIMKGAKKGAIAGRISKAKLRMKNKK